MNDRLLLAGRILAGLVFCVSAVLKFLSIDSFELYLYSLDWFPLILCFYLARLLIAAEFALGLGLMTNVFPKLVNCTSYLVLGLFSLFLVYLISVGYDGNCHCMGQYVDLPPIPSLIKNLVLFLLIFFSSNCKLQIPYTHIAVPAVSVVALVAIFIVSPPDGWLKMKEAEIHESGVARYFKNDEVFKQKVANNDKVLVAMLSTGCRVCRLSAKKLNLIMNKFNLPKAKVLALFHGSEHARKVFVADADFEGYDYEMLHPDDFGRMTGAVPAFMLFVNGELVGKYTYRSLTEDVVKQLQ